MVSTVFTVIVILLPWQAEATVVVVVVKGILRASLSQGIGGMVVVATVVFVVVVVFIEHSSKCDVYRLPRIVCENMLVYTLLFLSTFLLFCVFFCCCYFCFENSLSVEVYSPSPTQCRAAPRIVEGGGERKVISNVFKH